MALSASLTTAVLTDLFGAAGVVYATAIIGILVVVFAEVMPKTWALLRADRVALTLAPSIIVTLAVLGCAMLLESRLFRGRIQRLALMGAGYAGLAWLAVMYAHVVNVAALVVAAGLVVAIGTWLPGHRPSPFWGRAADVVDTLLIVAMIPLALGVAGVLSFLHGLNG